MCEVPRLKCRQRESAWQRPVQKLYPLEINCGTNDEKNQESGSSMESTLQGIDHVRKDDDELREQWLEGQSSRPKRAAAIEAFNRMTAQSLSD